MGQLRQGLRNDVKDLLFTFHDDPKFLTGAISPDVRCDNLLFERHSECQQMLCFRPAETYASVVATLPQVSNPSLVEGPTPMEIETTRRREPLSDAEKQRRRANRLGLYYGGPGHIVLNCPHKARRQVNQVNAHDYPISISAPPSRNPSSPSSPCHKNTFDVLSQLDNVLKE